jgi:hypothetical protein
VSSGRGQHRIHPRAPDRRNPEGGAGISRLRPGPGRVDFTLQPPEAAIPPEEDAMSIDATVMLRARFVQDHSEGTRAAVALFDAIVRLLTSGCALHQH